MRLGVDLSLMSRGAGAPPPPPQQQSSDPNVQSIAADGWRANYLSPVSFDPAGDPRYVLVDRDGFDAAGDPTTVRDALTIMSRVREPAPNEGTWTAEDVSLSDFIYAGDQTPGLTNQSTLTYPKPQALWLNHDRDIARVATYTARLAVAHAHARDGRPVAAVRFRASDGTTTVETLVTDMSVTSYSATGLSVPHFAGALDFSALQAGVLITIDADILPWAGPAFTISTDADTYPSVNLTTLQVMNDHDGSYGTAYAYIDAVSGNDGTASVSEDTVAAEANPYATLGAATLGLNQYNTANFGRASVSGGIIRLVPGVHTHQGFGWYAVDTIPLVIEAADPAQKAGTIYRDAGATQSNGLPDMVKLRNLTLQRNATGSVIFLDSAATTGSANLLVTDNCTWDSNGLGPSWNAWVYRVGRFWNINSDGEDLGQCKQFSTDFKAAISIGSGAGSLQSFTYHAVACRDLDAFMFDNTISGNVQVPGGDFFGWNHMGQGSDGKRCLNILRQVDDRGVAVVGNVIEQYGGHTGPAYSISADGIVLPADNVNVMGNTVVGSRTNLLYQDSGSAYVAKAGRCRFNIDYSWNSKDDTFLPVNGNRTGNWAFQYRVGFRTNAAIEGSNKGSDFGVGDLWLGEVGALGDASGSTALPMQTDFADDQSFAGGGAGGGDYTPGPLNDLPIIPAGLTAYSHDLTGSPIPDNGTAVPGAIQP